MRYTIEHIQRDGVDYELTLFDEGDDTHAVVSKDGRPIAQRRYKKDADIRISLSDLLASDIKHGLM